MRSSNWSWRRGPKQRRWKGSCNSGTIATMAQHWSGDPPCSWA